MNIDRLMGGQPPQQPHPPAEQAQENMLPIELHRDAIVEAVTKNPSVIIIGETGSGKTTCTPGFILDALPDARIAVTQPRRVAARSVAQFVAKKRGGQVGGEIGIKTRSEKETTEGTRCTFMTDGILLRMLQADPVLSQLDVVMIDEAHERSLNIDFCLGLLKQAQSLRAQQDLPPLKIIVASATIEKEKFVEYFGDAPTVEAPGRLYPVELSYYPGWERRIPEGAAHVAKQIIDRGDGGDILIFMPGAEEIGETVSIIETTLRDHHQEALVDILPLHGALSPEDQDKIFKKSTKRKIIVSTNIAETSLTIEGVRHVIDSGLIKQKVFDPGTGVESLVNTPHARSGLEQRKGRAGRTAPGTCHRLFSEDDFHGRAHFARPEILRSSLDHVVLIMKSMGIHDVERFDFMDKPEKEQVRHAVGLLTTLGALDSKGNITQMGERMAELPLRPDHARMIIEAHKYGCLDDVVTIVSMAGDRSPFLRPKDADDQVPAKSRHAEVIGNTSSDYIALLHVYRRWAESGFSDAWAREHFIHTRRLRESRDTRNQLLSELRRKGYELRRDLGGVVDDNVIEKSIVAGQLHMLAQPAARARYQYECLYDESKPSFFIHPGSVAFGGVGESLLCVTDFSESASNGVRPKTYVRKVQPVKPEWIIELAPHLVTDQGIVRARVDGLTGRVMLRTRIEVKGAASTFAVDSPWQGGAQGGMEAKKALYDYFVTNLHEFPGGKEVAEAFTFLRTIKPVITQNIRLPEMPEWFHECMEHAINLDQIRSSLQNLNTEKYPFLDHETLHKLKTVYPETMVVGGVVVQCLYEYRTVKLYIPESVLPVLKEDDFPDIGNDVFGKPMVKYCVVGYDEYDDSLDNLRTLIRARQRERAQEQFNPHDYTLPDFDPGVDLDVVRLHYAIPRQVAVGTDALGESVMVYLALDIVAGGDGASPYTYRLMPYKSEQEARDAEARAHDALVSVREKIAEKERLEHLRVESLGRIRDFCEKLREMFTVGRGLAAGVIAHAHEAESFVQYFEEQMEWIQDASTEEDIKSSEQTAMRYGQEIMLSMEAVRVGIEQVATGILEVGESGGLDGCINIPASVQENLREIAHAVLGGEQYIALWDGKELSKIANECVQYNRAIKFVHNGNALERMPEPHQKLMRALGEQKGGVFVVRGGRLIARGVVRDGFLSETDQLYDILSTRNAFYGHSSSGCLYENLSDGQTRGWYLDDNMYCLVGNDLFELEKSEKGWYGWVARRLHNSSQVNPLGRPRTAFELAFLGIKQSESSRAKHDSGMKSTVSGSNPPERKQERLKITPEICARYVERALHLRLLLSSSIVPPLDHVLESNQQKFAKSVEAMKDVRRDIKIFMDDVAHDEYEDTVSGKFSTLTGKLEKVLKDIQKYTGAGWECGGWRARFDGLCEMIPQVAQGLGVSLDSTQRHAVEELLLTSSLQGGGDMETCVMEALIAVVEKE